MTEILTNKITITTFFTGTIKYGINFTAAMGNFAWAVKQVWYGTAQRQRRKRSQFISSNKFVPFNRVCMRLECVFL